MFIVSLTVVNNKNIQSKEVPSLSRFSYYFCEFEIDLVHLPDGCVTIRFKSPLVTF